MSVDKYPCIFSRQIETIVYISGGLRSRNYMTCTNFVGFSLSVRMKEVCSLGTINYGGLQNVRPPINTCRP